MSILVKHDCEDCGNTMITEVDELSYTVDEYVATVRTYCDDCCEGSRKRRIRVLCRTPVVRFSRDDKIKGLTHIQA